MDFDQISILSPLELSLRVASLATLFSFVAATLMAWLLARKRGPLPALLDALCTLPLVLPPTVLGYYLILLVGRRGVFGHWLADMGINLIFSWQGAVVAATVVVFPLIYKSARAAIYDAFQAGNDVQAVWLVIITSAVCVSLLMAAELLLKLKWKRRSR